MYKPTAGTWTKNKTENNIVVYEPPIDNKKSWVYVPSGIPSSYTSENDKWVCQALAWDNHTTTGITYLNSSVVTVGDATGPALSQPLLNYATIYNDEYNQFYISVIDTSSSIEEVWVEVDRPVGADVNASQLTFLSGNNYTTGSTGLGAPDFDTVGEYNITKIFAKDSSQNWNSTKIADLTWVVSARPSPAAPTGGGGGGDKDETLECLTFIPDNLTFTFNRPAVNLRIHNNHSKSVPIVLFSKEPEELEDEELNAQLYISFRGEVPSSILSEDSVIATLIMNETAFTFNETLKARLVVEAEGCRDKTLSIFILQERNIFMQFIGVKSVNEFYSVVKNALLTKIFLGIRYFDLFILLTILIFVLTLLNKKPKSIFMYVPRIILSVVGGLILILIIYGVIV